MVKVTRQSAIRRLARWFDEHGWTQAPPDPELRKDFQETYKRGYEIRLSARPDELTELQCLLFRAGFEPGKHFLKGRRLVVPLYGKEQVEQFLREIRHASDRKRARSGSCRRASRG